MKRCLHLVSLLVLASSLHGCALWYYDHDYDAQAHYTLEAEQIDAAR